MIWGLGDLGLDAMGAPLEAGRQSSPWLTQQIPNTRNSVEISRYGGVPGHGGKGLKSLKVSLEHPIRSDRDASCSFCNTFLASAEGGCAYRLLSSSTTTTSYKFWY